VSSRAFSPTPTASRRVEKAATTSLVVDDAVMSRNR
jgi:hypothetical protein